MVLFSLKKDKKNVTNNNKKPQHHPLACDVWFQNTRQEPQCSALGFNIRVHKPVGDVMLATSSITVYHLKEAIFILF